MDSTYSPSYNNRGNARKYLGDFKGAIDDFNKAIAINPKYAIAYYNRGIAQQELGENKAACEDYDLAINYASGDLIGWIEKEIIDWCK